MGTYFPQYDTANTASRVSPKINTTAPGALAPRTSTPALGTPGNPIQLNPTPRTPTPARVTSAPRPTPNVTAGVTARAGRQTGGRVGGWVGAKAAATRAAARAGTGVAVTQADSPLPGPADLVGGAIIVGSGIGLALDLWQLAKGTQPEESIPPNDVQNTGLSPFEGGQCPGVLYELSVSWESRRFDRPWGSTTGSNRRVVGPIRGIELRPHSANGTAGFVVGQTEDGLFATTLSREYRNFRIFDVVRVDGLPDDCGNPPGVPEPAPPESPTRYRPTPVLPPRIIPQPQPPGQPGPTPQPQPGPQPEPAPDPGPNPGPTPTPNPGPTPTPDPRTDPSPDTDPPARPDRPDQPEEPDEGCDPCEKIDQLKELLIEAFSDSGSGQVALPACEEDEAQSENDS